jgi:transcription-repair coupling factor (superfamily II helicase)
LIGRVLVADWVRGAVLCQTTLLVEQPTEGFKERVFEALEAKVASLTQDRVQLAPTW